MSTTVTVKKAAAACRGMINGKLQVVYFLFERTYERNSHPHTPAWHCCAVGVYEEVMRWVLRGAENCASGMLQSRTGLIHPSNYVQAWRHAMEEPVEIDENLKVYLKRSSSWEAPVPASSAERVGQYLRSLEAGHLAEQMLNGETISLGIQACLQVVVDLYGVGGVIGQPWRVVKHHSIDWGIGGEPRLAPPRRFGILLVPKFEVFTVRRDVSAVDHGDSIVVAVDGGPFKTISYRYQAITWCLETLCYDAEMKRSGGTKTMVHALTRAIDQATHLPDETRVHLSRSEGSGARFEEIGAALGLGEKMGFQTISVPLRALRDNDLLGPLRAILPEYVRYERAH